MVVQRDSSGRDVARARDPGSARDATWAAELSEALDAAESRLTALKAISSPSAAEDCSADERASGFLRAATERQGVIDGLASLADRVAQLINEHPGRLESMAEPARSGFIQRLRSWERGAAAAEAEHADLLDRARQFSGRCAAELVSLGRGRRALGGYAADQHGLGGVQGPRYQDREA